ncbi:hypothetical protein J7E71_13465 [Mesobacillus foraminis]|uniref:HAAS domain-containing protein n=1 Tax=Mesobacillus foraminis TaxID=279826 RepID=UPI001BEA8773|nr:hypothetical protein [Mesobacillus foraminis]MBT2756952.1 hypothetical protein [Mesobacillus foraminis]
MKVSSESREFLENLRVYLLASGKNEGEIEEIVSELGDHLENAEKDGKDVTDIIGKTPKEYMGQLAGEMPFDLKGVLKFLPIVMLGAFSYILMGDAIRGQLQYSLIELIGYPAVFLLMLFLTALFYKYLASNKIPKLKQFLVFGIIGATPIALFIGLIYLDEWLGAPSIHFGPAAKGAAIFISLLMFIFMAIWSKSWVSIILPIVLFSPEVLIGFTDFQENTKIMLSVTIVPLCMGIYLLSVLRMEKKKEKSS